MFTQLCLTNFKAWKDTGPIALKPVTMLLGTNSSGKSTLIQSLLLLKQTVQSPDRTVHLNLRGDEINDLFNFGGFEDVLNSAITTVDDVFEPFITLSVDDIRGLAKMGGKSEPFCRQTLLVLDQNKGVLPPDFDLAEIQRDLLAFDTLRAPLLRLRELVAKAEHTAMALGSDVLTASLEGYALMKLFGKSEGLESLREAMSIRSPGRKGQPKPSDADG